LDRIILDFKGPFLWHGVSEEVVFFQEVADQPGIYLWCVEQQQGFLIYYVGETGGAFKDRFKSHTSSFFRGEYGIWSAGEFLQGKRVDVWPGRWRTTNKAGWPYEFIQRSPELIPKLIEFLGTIRIFLAPLEAEKLIRQKIESAVAAHLKNQSEPLGSFIDADIRHSGQSPKSRPLFVELNSPVPIQGLPATLNVQIPDKE
jgi:hypothetical protein